MTILLKFFGANLIFFLPVFGSLKPFDLISALVFFFAIIGGRRIKFFRYDALFILFFCLSLCSALMSEVAQVSNILQSCRYGFFFLLARIVWTDTEARSIIDGFFWGVGIVTIWIVIDVIRYFVVLDCQSLTQRVFFWVDYLPTHKSPFFVGGCLMFRPAGFAWDPGGFYPFILFVLSCLGSKLRFRVLFAMSVLALSKTAIMAVISSKYFPFANKFNPVILFFFFFAVLTSLLSYSFKLDFLSVSAGFLRHLSYPSLAIEAIARDPSLVLMGEGLRGAASALLWVDRDYFDTFLEPSLISSASVAVVESIWVNILLGAGLIAFVAYVLWLSVYLGRKPRSFLLLVVGGTFYTFDSSQFCFMVPFIMAAYKNRWI